MWEAEDIVGWRLGYDGVDEAASWGYDDTGCWVKQQPATADEQSRMITVLETQELGCIYYIGRDPKVLQVIPEASIRQPK